MKRHFFKLSAILLLIAVTLSACATRVKVEDTWMRQGAPATTYQKLLVIAVTDKSALRETFENIMAETLRKHGVAAVPSYPLLKDLKKANKAQVQALAKELGADAVIITNGLTREERTSYRYFGGAIQERVAVMESGDEHSSTIIAMSAIGVAPLESDFVKGTLMTRFFNVASAEMVWSALSEVINDGRLADACWDLSILLTKALAKDRLIAINDRTFRKPSL